MKTFVTVPGRRDAPYRSRDGRKTADVRGIRYHVRLPPLPCIERFDASDSLDPFAEWVADTVR